MDAYEEFATEQSAEVAQTAADNRSRPDKKQSTASAAPKPQSTPSRSLPPSVKTLRPRHQEFVKGYADPSSPSFGNATESYMKAGFRTNISVAGVKASRLVKDGRIRLAMGDLLDANGSGQEQRAQVLTDILNTETNNTVYKDADGTVRSVVTTDATKNRLKAIDVMSKLDGSYAAAEAVGDVTRKALDRELKRYEADLFQ